MATFSGVAAETELIVAATISLTLCRSSIWPDVRTMASEFQSPKPEALIVRRSVVPAGKPLRANAPTSFVFTERSLTVVAGDLNRRAGDQRILRVGDNADDAGGAGIGRAALLSGREGSGQRKHQEAYPTANTHDATRP